MEDIKRLTKDILKGNCKKYLCLGKSFGVYGIHLQDAEVIVIFDYHHSIIRTIGRTSWVKLKGAKYIFVPKKEKEEQYKNVSQKKRKRPYDRKEYKSKTRSMLQRDDELL